MKCFRCGKEMTNTIGGCYICEECGFEINDLVYRPFNRSESKPFVPQDSGKQEGWICPVCGRGVAPWLSVCPCQDEAGVINVTTTTEVVDLSKYYTWPDGQVPLEAKLNMTK